MRTLVGEEHAGFIADGSRCVEPRCSCWQEWQEGNPLPVSGPFRDPPTRCSSFEAMVLPLDPNPEAAYWDHLRPTDGAMVGQVCPG